MQLPVEYAAWRAGEPTARGARAAFHKPSTDVLQGLSAGALQLVRNDQPTEATPCLAGCSVTYASIAVAFATSWPITVAGPCLAAAHDL